MKGDSDEFLFAHCFLTLEWNLMAHADNVASAMVSHVEWLGDLLVFHFAKSKGAQEGECVYKPWHVYANLLEPKIFPVLAFSKYVLTHPGVLIGYAVQMGMEVRGVLVLVKEGAIFHNSHITLMEEGTICCLNILSCQH